MTSVKTLTVTLIFAAILNISQGQETTTAAEVETEATTVNLFETECSGFWSPWSECFPGSTSDPTPWQDRVFSLYPAQKDATLCISNATVNAVETKSCTTQEPELPDQTDLNCTYYGQYNCGNGRCISMSLLCNGDDDCGDNSDEYPSLTSGCIFQEIPVVCGLQQKTPTGTAASQGERFLTGIPGVEEFAGGFDLLSGEFRSNVLSMAGHGSCRKILISGSTDTYYRLPQNVASLRQMYEIVVDSTKLYESGAGIINTTKAGLKFNLNFGGQILDVEGRTGLSQSETLKDLVTQSLVDDQSKAYASVETSVNTAQITLKEPSSLEASTDFIKRVMKLPYSSFSNEMYLKFIEDFGTHYVTSAKLGGSYVDTDVYSRCWLDSVDYEDYSPLAWRRTVEDCTRQSFFARLDPDSYTLSSNCMANSADSSKTLRDEAVDYLVYISGGEIGASSDLKFSFGKAAWDPWVQSVVNSPILNMKDFKLEKISSLLSSPSILMNSTRRARVAEFLDQAIEIHMKPYDAEQLCQPCDPYSTDITDYDEEGNPVFLQNYGVQYLTGTGEDYQCKCVYDIPTKPDTCGSARHLATVFTLAISFIVALLNVAGH